ncbi:hypothetical protein K7432_015693 [Basidiobolus ranarum]|uniref:Nuclear pore complex protein Nup205 n=1 Tax=Basidiobolus ranarum TaxID=34480 RepID=A0ABR2WFT5_9FUNG
MFASLATGPKSSQYAYDFLNSGGGRHPNLMQSSNHTTSLCSWNALFGALDFYSTNLVPTQTISSGITAPAQIQPEEVILLKSFLRLLRQIVKYSSIARTTLYENQQYKPMYTLFNLLRCPVPTDLKAALLETIAAFCSPIGSNGPQIARQTWITLEQSQLLQTVRNTSSQSGSQFPTVEGGQFTNVRNLGQSGFGASSGVRKEGEGIRAELEEIESAKETYPETQAFLHLLNTLIYTPGKNSAYRSGFGIISPTIPDNLGSGYRAPGINPYINFVLDHILLKAHNRSYIHPEEKWAVIEASLKLVEKCLITFDIKSILIESVVPGPNGEDLSKSISTVKSNSTSQTQAAFSLATHPGFEIIARILCGSKLLEEICRILAFGVDAVNQNTFKTPAFRLCVLHSLRILLRVMQIQDIFLGVLVPIIVESNNSTTFGTKISLPPALVSVDQLLLYRKDVIVQIALFVNCFESDEICLLSVKALLALSESEAFGGRGNGDGDFSINKLVSVLNSSDDAARIIHGFLERLEIDEPEVDAVEAGINQHDDMYQAMSESSGGLDDQPGMANSIRLRILELLLKNLNPDKVPPTISHMLLGYQLKGGISETEIPDPMSDNAKVSCLHIILDLLREGIERSKGNSDVDQVKESTAQKTGIPLFTKHPSLAERCYHLIYRLCSNPNTSSPTMRYLRIREDYYYSQLKAMPVNISQVGEQYNGEIIYNDGTKVALDIAGLFAQLHQRAWLMRTIALELHITTLAGQRSQTQRLLNLLYGTGESIVADDTVSEDRFDISGISTLSKSKLQQTTMKMLEILNSVDFIWSDYLKSDVLEPFYFKSLNFEPCLRTNERGCYVYDIRAVFAMLSVAKKQFEKQGNISSAGQKTAIKEEMRLILNHFIVENRSRELFHAKFHCLQAWKQVVDITLSKCFDLLTPESRESVLYDLILSLLPKIISEDNTIMIAESLSGVVLSLLTKLRQDQQHQIVLQTPSSFGSTTVAVRLPADRLHTILKGLIESIQRPGSTITMRGNLYVALLSYLQYTNPSSTSGNQVKKDLEQSLTSSAFGRSLSSSLSATSRPVQRDNLEAGNLSILNIAGDKFLEILCRDGCDSEDVWKTVAFTLLDSLTLLWEKEKINQVTNYMLRRNFLRHFVEMLKRDDIALQELLQPEVDDLNALFVYESKLSLFLRIAQRRDGAEKLLENGVVEILSDIGFLDQRPNSDAMNTDFDSFIPPATERYHQLLTPLLQLLTSGSLCCGFGRYIGHYFVDDF